MKDIDTIFVFIVFYHSLATTRDPGTSDHELGKAVGQCNSYQGYIGHKVSYIS